MVSKINRAVDIYREDGFYSLLKRGVHHGYNNFIRSLLPATTADYNGVNVRNVRVGDRFLPWHTVDIPNYESALVAGIRERVTSGDKVVIVGGGWGVSTVAAARQAGMNGQVDTFEGSENAMKNVLSTVRLNNVTERVTVYHAIVARAHSLRGERGSAAIVSPTDLPECDVLILDCEGAELEILEEMTINPHTILVETHGMLNASESVVEDRLTQNSYKVIDRVVAEDRLREYCLKNEIFVLTAKK